MTPVDFLLRYMHSAPPIPEHLQRADHICLYERVGFSGPFNPVCLIDLTEEDKVIYSIIYDLVDNLRTSFCYPTSDGGSVYVGDRVEDEGITIDLLSQVVDMDSSEVFRRMRALADEGIMSGPFCFALTEEGVENYSLSRFWHLAVMHDKSKVLDKSLNASVPMIDYPSVFFSTQNTVEDRGVLRNWSQTCCKWYPEDNKAVQLPTRQFFAC